MQKPRPVEADKHGTVEIVRLLQNRERRLGEFFRRCGQAAIREGRLQFHEKPERFLRRARDGDDVGETRHALAVLWRKIGMRLSIPAPRPRAAHVIRLKLFQGQIEDARARRVEPFVLRVAHKIGLQAMIVEDNDLAVLRQLHIELGAVAAYLSRMRECRARVFGPEARAAAMGDVEGRHENLETRAPRLFYQSQSE